MARTWLLTSALILALAGCDTESVDDAKSAVDSTVAALSREYQESAVATHAERLGAAVEARDLDALRRVCCDEGEGDYRAIMTCYYDAFVIESRDGTEAARAYLREERSREGNSPARAKAVGALGAYFEAKGSLRTREVAGLVLLIALEARYPGHGAKIGNVVTARLGLVDVHALGDGPATAPAGDTSPAAP